MIDQEGICAFSMIDLKLTFNSFYIKGCFILILYLGFLIRFFSSLLWWKWTGFKVLLHIVFDGFFVADVTKIKLKLPIAGFSVWQFCIYKFIKRGNICEYSF